ncbi:MAG: anhydro-N-acetylmuramic acid kinase [Acidobacteria bacterium]|nr:anhydro-N-acetylmuramic acid kinase [Acidobacteriota bacterium]
MLVAGIMSGTSADAIDVALVEITGRGWKSRHRLVAFHSMKYPAKVRERILAIAGGQKTRAGQISQLNFLLGELFARACLAACHRAKIPLRRVRLIGSHGQTIYHQGRAEMVAGIPVCSTYQIGEPAVIAERTGVTTVADFRPADIAAGGQGAPLVPFFDYLTYRHPRKGRIALNIGGIANLTAMPAGGSPEDVIAFDTGPGNMLIDALAAKLTGGQRSFDAGGKLASSGNISAQLLARLMRHQYFHRPPPKTAGREQFGESYLQRYFLEHFGTTPQKQSDALATATALTAESIARAVKDFVLPKFPIEEYIVSGGGVRNRFLMSQLRDRLNAHAVIRVLPSTSVGVPAQAKEAIAFAVLAYYTYHREIANLPSATGARHPAILGKVVYAGR